MEEEASPFSRWRNRLGGVFIVFALGAAWSKATGHTTMVRNPADPTVLGVGAACVVLEFLHQIWLWKRDKLTWAPLPDCLASLWFGVGVIGALALTAVLVALDAPPQVTYTILAVSTLVAIYPMARRERIRRIIERFG